MSTTLTAVSTEIQRPSEGTGQAENLLMVAETVEQDAAITAELQPISQLIAGVRGVALAQLAALRLMSFDNPSREQLTKRAVDSLHRVLFAEEELLEELALTNGLKMPVTAAVFCSLHLRLDHLVAFKHFAKQESLLADHWELLVSELLQSLQESVQAVNSVFRSTTAEHNVDAAALTLIFTRAMSAPIDAGDENR